VCAVVVGFDITLSSYFYFKKWTHLPESPGKEKRADRADADLFG
jgi:hypothetical protein